MSDLFLRIEASDPEKVAVGTELHDGGLLRAGSSVDTSCHVDTGRIGCNPAVVDVGGDTDRQSPQCMALRIVFAQYEGAGPQAENVDPRPIRRRSSAAEDQKVQLLIPQFVALPVEFTTPDRRRIRRL